MMLVMIILADAVLTFRHSYRQTDRQTHNLPHNKKWQHSAALTFKAKDTCLNDNNQNHFHNELERLRLFD